MQMKRILEQSKHGKGKKKGGGFWQGASEDARLRQALLESERGGESEEEDEGDEDEEMRKVMEESKREVLLCLLLCLFISGSSSGSISGFGSDTDIQTDNTATTATATKADTAADAHECALWVCAVVWCMGLYVCACEYTYMICMQTYVHWKVTDWHCCV